MGKVSNVKILKTEKIVGGLFRIAVEFESTVVPTVEILANLLEQDPVLQLIPQPFRPVKFVPTVLEMKHVEPRSEPKPEPAPAPASQPVVEKPGTYKP